MKSVSQSKAVVACPNITERTNRRYGEKNINENFRSKHLLNVNVLQRFISLCDIIMMWQLDNCRMKMIQSEGRLDAKRRIGG